MKSRKLPNLALVRATWVDSQYAPGWMKATKGSPPVDIVTVGYVTQNTPELLTLASTVATDSDVLNPLSVPWGCIRKIEVLA